MSWRESFFVNPGSATGAISSWWWAEDEKPVPSFVLMDVQGSVLVMYVYQLRTDEKGNESVAVEKITYRKETPNGS